MIKTIITGSLSSLIAASVKPRDKAPVFSNVNAVVGDDFGTVSLVDYSQKYLVILFYPFDFTYVCPTELIAYSDAVHRFNEINASIVGISTDSHHTHLAWVRTPRTEGGLGKMQFPLLGDFSKDISRDYGVLIEDPKD
jgi:alkyl hydroperoxide reductase subunit AhpC